MNKSSSSKIGDDAVKEKTGKTWLEWFKTLDKASAIKMNHKEIVSYLKKNFDLNGWWQQMVTVTYEQERGMRKVHEKPEGFQISKSKSISAPVSKLFKAWTNENNRMRWLKDSDFIIRKKTTDKNIRIIWIDNITTVEVMFYPKDNFKTQIVVQHSKLKNAREAEKMKKYWADSLKKLAQFVED
jgi:uncharacterized protein YndB with AHSA1/START domain